MRWLVLLQIGEAELDDSARASIVKEAVLRRVERLPVQDLVRRIGDVRPEASD
jgi:hypothetical protein